MHLLKYVWCWKSLIIFTRILFPHRGVLASECSRARTATSGYPISMKIGDEAGHVLWQCALGASVLIANEKPATEGRWKPLRIWGRRGSLGTFDLPNYIKKHYGVRSSMFGDVWEKTFGPSMDTNVSIDYCFGL